MIRKRILAFLMTVFILAGYGDSVLASELISQDPSSSSKTGFSCRTDPDRQEAMSRALLSKKAQEIRGNSRLSERFSRPNKYVGSTLMPSTGDVKIPALLIDFEGYRMEESLLEEFEKYFNTKYDDSLRLKSPFAQSVRGAYEKLSYGRLDLTADIMVYHAEYEAGHYVASQSDAINFVKDILKSYVEEGLLSPSDYDSDHDGVVDGVIAKFYLPPGYEHTSYFSSYENDLLMDVFGGCTFTVVYGYKRESIWDLCRTDSHEIGHMMGLPDRYDYSDQVFLDYALSDFMTAGCDMYLNVYEKFLLGWIDPVILTNEDAPTDMELSAVESYSQDNGPKAVALIPDPLLFPFTEFFIAEYRNASQEPPDERTDYATSMYRHPGVVIWHCDTERVHYNNGTSGWYRREKRYIQPVYRSGKTREPDGWQQSIYDASDLYVERSIFSSTSRVNSDFYGGVYTGAYLQVKSITQEKATIRVGFRDPDLTPAPEIHISGPSKKAVQSLPAAAPNETHYTVTCTVGGEIIPFDELNDYSRKAHVITTGSLPKWIGYAYDETNPMPFVLLDNEDWEGTVRLSISDGYMTYHGKPSRAAESEVLYVDSTPPEITLRGADPQIIERGETYQELGAEVQDNLDPEIEDKLEIDSSGVDTGKAGTYTVLYSAVDHAENSAHKTRTVIVEDTTAPTAKVEYSTTQPTGGAVTAKLRFSEPVTLTANGSRLTPTADPLTYTASIPENCQFTIGFEDPEGNVGTAEISVSNIDSSLPVGTVTYDTTLATNKKVIAAVNVPPGVQIVNNGGKKEYVFTENGSFDFKIRDASGKTGMAAAVVDWIDKTPPEATVKYSSTRLTNQDVTAVLVPSEDVTVIGGEASYTFQENGFHKFTFQDAAGNTGSVTAAVDWIDKTLAAVTVQYAPAYPTNSRVVAILSSEEEITVLNGGNSHRFTSNGTWPFRYQDKAGNIGSVVAEVNWIDKKAPTATVEYSIDPTVTTFSEVTATLVPSEKVKVTNNEGSLSHTFTTNGSFVFEFEDEAGNRGTAAATVGNINQYPPAVVNFDHTKDMGPTAQNVTATVTTFSGCTILSNGGENTHVFTDNGTYGFLIRNQYKEEAMFFVTVDWIDKTPPTATVSYSTEAPVNGSVTATVTFSEPITLTSGGDRLTASWKPRTSVWNSITASWEPLAYETVLTENGSFDFSFEDKVGNAGKTGTIKVDWIDKSAPTAAIEYSVTGPTNQDVTATIVPSKEVTVTSLGGESHTFSENGSFTFSFEDQAGNVGTATAQVNWIDRTPPTAAVEYSATDWTNQAVTAAITPSEELAKPGASLTHTFTDNGFFTFDLTDAAGNKGEAVAAVSWIDKEAPVIELKGANPQTILCGGEYTELGAEVTDDLDEGIGAKLETDASKVDTGKAGTYTVTYTAVDHAGNKAEVTRDVIVEELHVHTLTKTEGKPATCTAEGNLEYWTCSGCGSVFSDAAGTMTTTVADRLVAKLPHTPGAAATCTQAQTCTECGEVLEAAKGHKPGAGATCTQAQTCTVCGAEINPVLKHNYKETVTAPTCTAGGYTTHTCSRCQDSYQDSETNPLGHNLENWTVTKAPTCTEEGVEQGSCSRCSYSETRDVAANGHTPGDAATCTQAQTCTVCGEVLEAAKGHNPSSAATCTQAQTCTVCGEVLEPAKGHKPGAAATCTQAQTCTECGEVLEAAKGHNPSSAATCTQAQTCTECGEVLEAAKGHKPGAAATCTQAQTCTMCGEVLEAAKGHTPGNWEVISLATTERDGLKVKKCTVCQAELDRETIPKLTPEPTPKPTPKPPTPSSPPIVEPGPAPSPSPGPAPEEWSNPFVDVKRGDWFYDSVKFVCEKGLMSGFGNNKFGPNNSLTRAELAQILYNKEDRPAGSTGKEFADVGGQWYANAVTWASEKGLVSGYGNGRFGPNDPITREQLAAILWRYAGSPESKASLDEFTDRNKITDYAVPALRWAVEQKIVNGKGDGILDPKGNAARAEVAAMLERFYAKDKGGVSEFQ